MSAPIDCPICMDCIESTTKNCVTTECGHCFHTNCLMQSVAHNGFGCPYCRTAMADEPDDASTEYPGEEDDEEEPVDPLEDNDMLRGFRFFFNNVNGEDHDEDDVEEEIANELLEQEEEEEEDPNVPSINFVAQKLKDQGVTFEQLVHMMCNLDHEEYNEDDLAERFSDELFGKIRVIVSNYTPEQAASDAVEQLAPVAPSAPEVDFEAQPKTYQVRTMPRFMIHV